MATIPKTKDLYKDGVLVTDENIIKSQVSEMQDTGSFAKGYEVKPVSTATETKEQPEVPEITNLDTIETPEVETPEVPEVPETPEVTTDTTDTADSLADEAKNLKDKEIEEAKKNRDKAIEETKRGFALGKGKFEENKGYYENYDELNNKYNAVLDEITANMGDTGVVDDSVYQSIANKYGLTLEQVKNPNRIFDDAILTEEGKDKLGVDKFEQGIEDSTTEYEQTIEEMQTNLERTQEAYRQQLDSSAQTVKDMLDSGRASGAATGGYRSSVFQENLNRVKQEGDRAAMRIQNALSRDVGAIRENISILTEEFNKSITEAKDDFESNLRDVNQENLLAITELENIYGPSSEELQNALKEIEATYQEQTSATFTNYLNNLSNINSLVNDSIDINERIADREEEKNARRYDQYLENNGLLLQNATLQEIIEEVRNGTLTTEYAKNLRNIMQSSIQSTLGAISPLQVSDIDTIAYLLEQGYTPQEVVASMQETYERFQTPEETATTTQDWAKLDDGTLYNKRTGDIKGVGTTQDVSSYYSGFRKTQGFGDISPNSKDTGANGGTPGEDFAMPVGTPVSAISSGTVISVGDNGDYGNQVVVQDIYGNQHMYSHLSDFSVQEGDTIEVGQELALSGNTGFSTGPHLDYRVKSMDGEWVDPKNFLGIGDGETILGVTGAPLSFERQIKQKVPSTLQNSDGEREQLNQTIKIMADAGMSAEEAALTFMGFDIDIVQNPEVQELATEYINIGRNMGEDTPDSFYPTISNYMNAGDYAGADTYVNNIVEDKVQKRYGTDFIPQAMVKNATRNISEIISIVNANRDKIGAVDGRLNKLYKKFGDNSDIQRLETLMTGTFADLRKNFAGSAVTSTELAALADYIAGDIKEQPDNLITKLNTVMNMQTNEFIEQRNQFGYNPQGFEINQIAPQTQTEVPDINDQDTDDLIDNYF